MIWLIIALPILLLLFWILMGPVILYVDTIRKRYHVRLPGVFRVAIVPFDGLFHIRGWIFFIPFKFDPFKSRQKRKDKRVSKKKSSKKWKSPGLSMFTKLVRSIRVKKLDLDIDTDDFTLNAYLVPAFSIVNSGNILMRANFEGRLSLLMDIRVRIGTLIWIMIKHKYKSSINF